MQNYVNILENSVKNLEILVNISRVFCKLVDLGSLMFPAGGWAWLTQARAWSTMAWLEHMAGTQLSILMKHLHVQMSRLAAM